MEIDDGDTLKQFIQPLTYRLSKTIELNQKWFRWQEFSGRIVIVRPCLFENRVQYFDFLV